MADSSQKTIMLVGAHHDDNEGNVGGTVPQLIAAGWRVVSVVMTNGRWGGGVVNDDNIKIRNNESLAAGKLLGMEVLFMGFREAGFRATPEACDAMVETIIEYQPNVIATHPPHDYHFDHMETSKCVLDATYLCTTAAMEKGKRAMPRLYYYDAVYVPFEPDVFVDITEYAELKADSQRCHESQIPQAARPDGGIVELARVRARYRGYESGVKYAEAFRFVPKLGMKRMAKVLE